MGLFALKPSDHNQEMSHEIGNASNNVEIFKSNSGVRIIVLLVQVKRLVF